MSRKRKPMHPQRRRAVAESVAAPERHDVAEAGIAEASKKPGRMLIQLISAGWSLNRNFYPAEVLKRDGARAFPKGTHAFIDHATPEEDMDRPVGSVSKLAGALAEDAYWDEQRKALVAEVKLFAPWREPLTDMAEDIGMSIRAYATGEHGEREGQSGMIIDRLDEGRSVDFVTKPAAGGKILAVFESLQEGKVAEARNIGTWLESRLHLALTQLGDDMYGDGRLTRNERITLSSAIGDALQAWTARVEDEAPQLFKRGPWDDAPDEGDVEESPEDAAEASEAVTAPARLPSIEVAEDLARADQALSSSPISSVTANAPGSPPAATQPNEGDSAMSGTTTETPQGLEAGNQNGTPVAEEVAVVAAERDQYRDRCNSMTAALTEAQAEARTARAERDQAVARALLLEGNEAGRIAVDKALAAEESGVPESMYASIAPRVHAAVRGNVPMTDDGKVNTEALEALVASAIKAERTYVASVLESQGIGQPAGLGGDPNAMTEADFEAQNIAAFEALGMDTETAKLAAKGR